MDEHRKQQVSMRGASAKEISRDALLEKVSQERDLRGYTRRATAAALFVRRVWRRHYVTKLVSLQLQQQWLTMMNTLSVPPTKMQISSNILRPFLFFVRILSTRPRKIGARDADRIKLCFRVVLESINASVTEESLGKRHVIELKPGGKDICVANENKLQYIHALADYKLNRQILPFSNAFYRGLTDLISPSWLKLFNAGEFNQLLSGGNHDIDVDDLRKNTRYTGGYTEGSRTIKLFWEVLVGFEPKERCMLLKFVTSCSRAPLLGFKHLQPAFTIHKVACDVPLWASFGGQDVNRLPSASTCYNTLKLPTYKCVSTLREKLLYAINSNAGFELS